MHVFHWICSTTIRRVIPTAIPASWPVDPFRYHALSTLREIRLLAEAGLASADILVAATVAPAAMLGREGELGAIVPGALADLVLLDGDPLRDASAFERVRWTIRDGVARTPNEWRGAQARYRSRSEAQ